MFLHSLMVIQTNATKLALRTAAAVIVVVLYLIEALVISNIEKADCLPFSCFM